MPSFHGERSNGLLCIPMPSGFQNLFFKLYISSLKIHLSCLMPTGKEPPDVIMDKFGEGR